MQRGWTKRWRKRWDKGYHKNFLLWVMMDYFIDFAAHEPKDIYLNGHGLVHLERGEWAFTQRELADFFNVGRQQIRDQLDFLKKDDFLTQDTTQSRTQHITKINIINYDTYQDKIENSNPTKNPKENQASTQLPNPTIYTKNYKNTSNRKKSNNEEEIYNFYIEKISPENRSGTRARSNIKSHLKNNSPDDLKQAILNYSLRALKSEPLYRKDPANFFGKNEPYFKDFLPGVFQKPKSQQIKYSNPEEDAKRM